MRCETDTLLQNLLIVDKVPAWMSNRVKRLVLAPKRYLVDAGLFTGISVSRQRM